MHASAPLHPEHAEPRVVWHEVAGANDRCIRETAQCLRCADSGAALMVAATCPRHEVVRERNFADGHFVGSLTRATAKNGSFKIGCSAGKRDESPGRRFEPPGCRARHPGRPRGHASDTGMPARSSTSPSGAVERHEDVREAKAVVVGLLSKAQRIERAEVGDEHRDAGGDNEADREIPGCASARDRAGA